MVILCQTTSNRRGTESILQANKISLRMMQYIKRILTELKFTVWKRLSNCSCNPCN
ncbi:hypothetical protein ABEB36_004567 [Hypothenemus hampei]|uniref:Uncharacterized protein n=1 Tax=Hypothenemus hampei TaxID=57062 RepID=A0ABD1F7G5_HYPHA